MKIIVVTPEGELYNEEVTSVIVSSANNGEYGILTGHLPIVSTIDTGFVRMTFNQLTYYVAIVNGLVQQVHDVITVIAQDAYIGESKESAFENLNQIRKARIESNRQRNLELAMAENELKKQIKQTGAGNI
ncbi:MAG: ATP synthase F1 subunit epsilon [Tenericutes bacterium HGW-Tenericutes-1]|jgi:F-type H+-transporting ATPase subunit epsilon|nr:MAG: ATP synthase F1 subunit epsilon [Tenericutes bacterium HGW-Tenericutes-1]